MVCDRCKRDVSSGGLWQDGKMYVCDQCVSQATLLRYPNMSHIIAVRRKWVEVANKNFHPPLVPPQRRLQGGDGENR